MNKHKLINFLILSAFTFQIAQARDIQVELETIRKQYTPDPREQVFDYEFIKMDSGRVVIKGVTTSLQAKQALGVLINQLNVTSNSSGTYLDSLRVIPAPADSLPPLGVCRLSVADIRTSPSFAAEMASQALLGTPLQLLEYNRGWYRVRTPDNYLGWINGSSIRTMQKQQVMDWLNAPKVIVTAHWSSLLKRKGDYSEPVCDLVMGNLLQLKSRQKGWFEVVLPDGRSGFVPQNQVEEFNLWYKNIEPSSESLISLGRTFMGLPYTWGGTSSKMLDCSGFMRTLFFMHGIYLKRDASQQVKQGSFVDTTMGKDLLMPGDLLFFGTKGREGGRDRVTHVGLYIGNGEYIHEAGLVHISSFDPAKDNYSSYYDEAFLCARRILGYETKNLDSQYLRIVNGTNN